MSGSVIGSDHMLRDEKANLAARPRLNIRRAYCGPFARPPRRYSELLRRLYDSGMLRWRFAEDNEQGELGIFCVPKESGQLRLIFDTRLVNTRFRGAPPKPLPSVSAFSALDVSEGDVIYGADGNIRCYFYSMVEILAEMSDLFTLPTCRACALGLAGTTINGRVARITSCRA